MRRYERQNSKNKQSAAYVAQQYIDDLRKRKGDRTAEYAEKTVKRFLERFGSKGISDITDHALLNWRDSMIDDGLAASTIRDNLTYAKAVFKFSWQKNKTVIPNLSLIRPPTQAAKRKRAWSVAEVQSLLQNARNLPERGRKALRIPGGAANIEATMRLMWLGCMRPGELLRCIAGEGEWTNEWLFVPAESKTARKSIYPRTLVLSSAAVAAFKQTQPVWGIRELCETGAFSAFFRSQIGTAIHGLRHSAANTLLNVCHVQPMMVSLCLGHYGVMGQSLTYADPPFDQIREAMEKLALLINDESRERLIA